MDKGIFALGRGLTYVLRRWLDVRVVDDLGLLRDRRGKPSEPLGQRADRILREILGRG